MYGCLADVASCKFINATCFPHGKVILGLSEELIELR